MSSLASVKRFVLPGHVIDQTLEVLQDIGKRGFESFVLWGGRLDQAGVECVFESAYCPEQRTTQSENGLLVEIDGEALFRANRAFYERGQILAAQVHTHPTTAYHSEVDDQFPLMTLVGGLSVVVPNFASEGRDGLSSWMWYRLVSLGSWVEVAPNELIAIEQ